MVDFPQTWMLLLQKQIEPQVVKTYDVISCVAGKEVVIHRASGALQDVDGQELVLVGSEEAGSG